MNEARARAFDNMAAQCTAEEINDYIKATMDKLGGGPMPCSERELWLEDLERWVMHYRTAVMA